MKYFKFLLAATVTILLTFALDRRISTPLGPMPPLGKFLDPYNGFWQNAESNDPEFKANLKLPGVNEEVTVIYDSLLIPHIFANNEEDLYFAQGYVTAVHRLWQMEFQTHAAAGRISEIIGEAALDFDRGQRRKGMVFGAQNAVYKMLESPITKKVVESYSAGVNAYINSLEYADYPLEYKLLDYQPESWVPLKCALLLKYMANTLNVSEKDLQNTNFLKLYGLNLLNLLYPDMEQTEDPIVNKPGAWDFNPITIDSIPLAIPDIIIDNQLSDQPDPNTGSNNWAVAGSKTQTGSPILSSDPHLTLNLPSIWFAIQLNAPGVNTMGVSLPGAPNVIIGFNENIAWGATNAQRDLVDWYKIEFQDTKRDRYLLDGIWVPTQRFIEEFKIRDGESFYDTLIFTHWGPVMYDRNYHPGSGKSSYSMRWIAHDPSDESMTFYLLNRAENHGDYMNALDYYVGPAQNFAFASVNGDIAIRVQGKYPVRRKYEGKFLLDGSESSQGWQAFIPYEQNIRDLNPERGFVSSANQYPVDSTYPYYITARRYQTFRNRRINEVLRNSENITVKAMMDLQNDNFNVMASDILPFMLANINELSLNQEQRGVLEILNTWDYYNEAESEAASYFEEWWDNFYLMLWDEIANSDIPLSYPSKFTTIRILKDSINNELIDNKDTEEEETVSDLINASFFKALEKIQEWKDEHGDNLGWAVYKNTYIQHLARLAPFSRHVKNGGNHDIVNATSSRNGPSWRMVVSLEKNGVKAWGVYPGGQSGNPGSPYYLNLSDKWEAGEYYQLSFMKNSEDNSSLYFLQTINPGE